MTGPMPIDIVWGGDELGAQTLVRPLLMIMLDKRSDGSPEVRFTGRVLSRHALYFANIQIT